MKTTQCEWGICDATATTTVEYPAVVPGTGGAECDWRSGVVVMRLCDDCASVARAEVADRYQISAQVAARTLGSRGGRADSPAQRDQRARVMGHGRPVVARASYRSSATLRATKGYQIAMAEAEQLRADGSAGQPDARRTQVMDTIDGLVGRHTGAGRMAWPREIVLAAHLA